MFGRGRLDDFIKALQEAPINAKSERIIRYTLEGIAKDCPLWVLQRLGQCVIDCREEELRKEAESN